MSVDDLIGELRAGLRGVIQHDGWQYVERPATDRAPADAMVITTNHVGGVAVAVRRSSLATRRGAPLASTSPAARPPPSVSCSTTSPPSRPPSTPGWRPAGKKRPGWRRNGTRPTVAREPRNGRWKTSSRTHANGSAGWMKRRKNGATAATCPSTQYGRTHAPRPTGPPLPKRPMKRFGRRWTAPTLAENGDQHA